MAFSGDEGGRSTKATRKGLGSTGEKHRRSPILSYEDRVPAQIGCLLPSGVLCLSPLAFQRSHGGPSRPGLMLLSSLGAAHVLRASLVIARVLFDFSSKDQQWLGVHVSALPLSTFERFCLPRRVAIEAVAQNPKTAVCFWNPLF